MSQNQKTPTETTCEFVQKCALKNGLQLVREDKSWIVFIDQRTQHKLCVSLSKASAPKVDTTVDISNLDGVMLRGRDADPNGKFVSLFIASAPLIEAAIKAMATADTIRPTRRAAKKAPVAFRLEEETELSAGTVVEA